MTYLDHSEKMLNMRIFLLSLFLIISFQHWTKAEDIREFEIEGISLGDSLLKYMSKKAIIDDLEYIYPDDGYWAVTVSTKYAFEIYDNVMVHGKKNDSNYYIYSITGDLFHSDIDKCLKKKEEISANIKNTFSYISTEDITKKHASDSATTTHSTWYDFDDGSILVACYDWSKKSGHPKTTKVTLDTIEFIEWLDNKAYN